LFWLRIGYDGKNQKELIYQEVKWVLLGELETEKREESNKKHCLGFWLAKLGG
jgi:hypothetical protein